MDWSFASGCSPPRLSATQFPSATDSQCSVRWGLPPHCWCALSGAHRGRDDRLGRPSLRTEQADYQHSALQLVVGLRRRSADASIDASGSSMVDSRYRGSRQAPLKSRRFAYFGCSSPYRVHRTFAVLYSFELCFVSPPSCLPWLHGHYPASALLWRLCHLSGTVLRSRCGS